MGNSGSQSNQAVSQREIREEQWAHSFPRTQTTKFGYQHKVLPDRNGDLKLKSTNNGDILHSGGTLSGKPKLLDEKKDEYSSHGFREDNPAARKYFPKEKETQYRSRAHGVQHKLIQNASSQKNLQGQIKLCVSEPDLRYSSSESKNHLKEKKGKKKYKAPPPPSSTDRPYLDWNETNNLHMPIRKARLFKTRAEMKKQSSQTNENMEYSDNPINIIRTSKSNRLSLPEIKLADEDFFEELKMATRRLRYIESENKTPVEYDSIYPDKRDKLKQLDPNARKSPAKENPVEKIDDNKDKMTNYIRGEASGKESTTPEMSPEPKKKSNYTREKPKTFYFGMNEEPVTDADYDNDIFDKFSNSFHQNTKLTKSSASDISSDIHSDDNDIFKSGLDLQLRPILPKKQLEIPKFSPAAAWRLLTMDANDKTGGTVISDDVSVLIEERIEKFARPPPPMIHAGQRSSYDKSGDSGISGDDPIPNGAFDDSNEVGVLQDQHVEFTLSSCINPQERTSWTPQQDLGDDSSVEEFKNQKSSPAPTSRIRSGPHIFSLSLPRDNQLAAYMIERSSLQYSGLQKLKKSLSGVLGNFSNKKDVVEADFNDEVSANWFLSKSAPNSLNNAFHSLEMRKNYDKEQLQLLNVNKQARMMYLPEAELSRSNRKTDDAWSGRHSLVQQHSKSCEDLTMEVKKTPEPLQDSAEEFSWKVITIKPKKFTFQSTIRQIEKRRLSEKLSREAERREQKRIQELEAMEKVEEEFQRKRAREKADIRQQLRLIFMEKNPAWSSLPPNLEINAEVRPEPDGAFSSTSSASPPPKPKTANTRSVQKYKNSNNSRTENNMKIRASPENSEFASAPREYMDYRGVNYTIDGGVHRHTTVHPEITYNMPKVKGTKLTQTNINQRRDVGGIRSTITVGSNESDNSLKYRSAHSKHNTPMPMSYFRDDQLHC